MLCRKAASTESEAQERADVLAKAGVVLRFNGLVYLKPQEVSEIVYKVRHLNVVKEDRSQTSTALQQKLHT